MDTYAGRAIGWCRVATIVLVGAGASLAPGLATAAQDTGGGSQPASTQEKEPVLSKSFDALAGYGFEQKDQFAAWLDARLARLKQRIDDLRKAVSPKESGTTHQWQETLAGLEARVKTVSRRVTHLHEATPTAWITMKWDALGALDELEHACDEAAQKINGGSADKAKQ